MTPAAPGRVLSSVTQDVLPSHQHHYNVELIRQTLCCCISFPYILLLIRLFEPVTTLWLLSISSLIIDRFYKFLHCYIQWQICNQVIVKDASLDWTGWQDFQTQQTSWRYKILLRGVRTPASVILYFTILRHYDGLFSKILNSSDHVLHLFPPPPMQQNYNLSNRPRNRQLPERSSRLIDCSFITRMLYYNIYWLLHYFISFYLCRR